MHSSKRQKVNESGRENIIDQRNNRANNRDQQQNDEEEDKNNAQATTSTKRREIKDGKLQHILNNVDFLYAKIL